jgi:L-rhamnose isomerase
MHENGTDGERAYLEARDRYAALGVSTDEALARLNSVSLSLHCWQGDDVGGFEPREQDLEGSGIRVTGRFPGKARTPAELRQDLRQAFALIPGSHRVNLHAMYGEFGGSGVDRDRIEPRHFEGWRDWAAREGLKLDFNATCFAHPKADSGFTLSHRDAMVRDFWIEHVKRCRAVSDFLGETQSGACIHNLWIPDGSKDITVDRLLHRRLLKESLDRIYAVTYSDTRMKDALESKLFGIGSESYVVGSHEFYMGYALTSGKMLCLDTGHFHPTEAVADKISALLVYADELLLHISRGIRWDSDHVVILNDEVRDLLAEVVRAGALDNVHIALDFFDAGMNRVGAWVIGARAVLKALLMALLEPTPLLRQHEEAGDHFQRLALLEDAKTLPIGVVWDRHCRMSGVPSDLAWIAEIQRYEKDVLAGR